MIVEKSKTKETHPIANDSFRTSVQQGLSATPKFLPSRYFYDKKGDALFTQIMELPEYYLTRCEYEILTESKEDLLQAVRTQGEVLDIVELGAGDGLKTKILLNHFLDSKAIRHYFPVDISANVLSILENSLSQEFPELSVRTVNADYFEALKTIGAEHKLPKLVLFLGSNIGNFIRKDAENFLCLLSAQLWTHDRLLIGFDLKKDPEVIYHAYRDREGVTEAFNFNLLHRINKELGGDFDTSKFIHYPVYDPITGEMKSYLISKEKQNVHLKGINEEFKLEAWEPIFTEVSMKYSLPEIKNMAKRCDLEIEKIFTDHKGYYVNVLMKKIK